MRSPLLSSSFLLATVLWGFLLALMTELLSLVGWLDFLHVLAAWGLVLLLLLLVLVLGDRRRFQLHQDLHFASIPRFERSLLVCLFLVVSAIGLIAWMAPPNAWDAMTYHLGRVTHWIQK